MAFGLFVRLLALISVFWTASSLSCSTLTGGSSLPCVEIPACSVGTASLVVDQLSNGKGNAKSSSTASLCHADEGLKIDVDSFKQQYFPAEDEFVNCNDPVFNADVVELFIAANGTAAPHCYSEIDTSPYNVIFESGIYNPNLNHSGVSNYLMDCSTSQVEHQTSVKKAHHTWSWTISVAWDVIENPQGCPVARRGSTSMKSSQERVGSIYRGNFYRVNELQPVASTCSSSTCEYMAWSPTLSNPPAFHEPTKFGYFLLV
eukprot:gene4947-5430_t